MAKTSIEWTDHSVSPIRARSKETGKVFHFCERISAGCANCYAATMAQRFGLPDYVKANRDKVEFFLDESKLQDVLRRKKPTRYFWEDCSDLFGHWVPDEWIDRCLAVMALTQQHTHQVLTKRPERMREYFAEVEENGWDGLWMRWGAHAGCLLDGAWIHNEGKRFRKQIERFISVAHGVIDYDEEEMSPHELAMTSNPIPGLWLGISVEHQAAADARIPLLLQTPAAVRFLSVEPLLGPVDLTRYLNGICFQHDEDFGGTGNCAGHCPTSDWLRQIHWVIVGCESGPKRRPMQTEWAESIADQRRSAGVAFFMKQMSVDGKVMGDVERFPASLRIRQFPKGATA